MTLENLVIWLLAGAFAGLLKIDWCHLARGKRLLHETDNGLAKARAGTVLVTPAFIRSIHREGIAER